MALSKIQVLADLSTRTRTNSIYPILRLFCGQVQLKSLVTSAPSFFLGPPLEPEQMNRVVTSTASAHGSVCASAVHASMLSPETAKVKLNHPTLSGKSTLCCRFML